MPKVKKKTVEETPANMGKNLATLPAGPGAAMEIVFSFDTTGSMRRCIAEVRKNLSEIIDRLLVDIPSLRVAVFAHGDYCDFLNYVTRFVDFTNDANSLKDFVNSVRPTDGGDWAECYELVLRQTWRDLSWAPGSQRALVMIGDSIPHGPKHLKNKFKINWESEVDKLYNDMGVRIYAVQCHKNESATHFYKHLADKTFGKHLNLSEFPSIVNMLLAICYRETGAEYFENYEREVRALKGDAIPTDVDSMLVDLKDRADPWTPSTTSGPGGMTSVLDTDDEDIADDSGIGLDDDEVDKTRRKLETKTNTKINASVASPSTSRMHLRKRKRTTVVDVVTSTVKRPSLSTTSTRPRLVRRQASSKHTMKLRGKRLLGTVSPKGTCSKVIKKKP